MRLFRAVGAAAAVVSTFAVLLTPNPVHAAPGDTITLPVRDALTALSVQNEDRTGYERTKFRHWTDADRDSCNTRQKALLEEAVTAPAQDANCVLAGGSWYSPYDDTYFTQARALDIDHMVPLAESWDSGASAWTASERQAYTKNLDDPCALIAVSAASSGVRAGSLLGLASQFPLSAPRPSPLPVKPPISARTSHPRRAVRSEQPDSTRQGARTRA